MGGRGGDPPLPRPIFKGIGDETVNPISVNPGRGVGTVPALGWVRVGLRPPRCPPHFGPGAPRSLPCCQRRCPHVPMSLGLSPPRCGWHGAAVWVPRTPGLLRDGVWSYRAGVPAGMGCGGGVGSQHPQPGAGTGAFPPAVPAALSGGGQPRADPPALIPLAPGPRAASPASPPHGNRGWYVGAAAGPACRCRRPGAAPGPAPAPLPAGPLTPEWEKGARLPWACMWPPPKY